LEHAEFRQIVVEHQARVFSIAYRILADRGVAEEVAQDLFLALYGVVDGLASPEHIAAWVRRVAVHRATDALRRRPRTLHAAGQLEDWMAQCSPEPAASTLTLSMEQLLLHLPAVQRSLVLLRYQEDLTPDEIATTMGMPVATVKSYLQRALRHLRTQASQTWKEYMRHA
jgi:RNA polymerase sigma-70 factor (ECF subfamily)